MNYIGIDPGLSGALAFLAPELQIVEFFDIPTIKTGKTRKVIYSEIQMILDTWTLLGPAIFIIEKTHAMPKQGVTSMFNFGKICGVLLGIASTYRLPIHEVAPQTWKKSILKDSQKEKDDSRIKAIELFPRLHKNLKLKKHHNRAEALLLAEYARRENL